MACTTTVIKDFEEFSRKHALFKVDQKLLVAVSGGVDSVVLLDLLIKLRSDFHLDLAVAHVNHQLRGEESTGDETFVRHIAADAGIPFYCRHVDTIGLKHSLGVSKQVAARGARYQFFDDVRRQTGADHVAIGHQADDNAETVLFNALRGGGLRGLAGIPISRVSAHIIRPLLFARRKLILEYAKENGIKYRNDSSNRSLVYSRNYLRHLIIPNLGGELGGDASELLNRVSSAMKTLSRHLDKLIDDRFPGVARFNGTQCNLLLSSFLAQPLFLQEEIVLRVLRHLNIEPSTVKISNIIDLGSKQSGHSVNLSGHHGVYKDRGHLVFCEEFQAEPFSTTVELGNTYTFDHFTFTLGQPGPRPSMYERDGRTEYVDCDMIKHPLTVRSWKPGDWFVPLGMNGKKKLSDFFNDIKAPYSEKMHTAVFESNEDIVWVCGKRLDSRYRITDSTRNTIRLTISPSNSRPIE